MKKLIQLAAMILGITSILYISSLYVDRSEGSANSDTLNIFNWGDYIDPDLLDQFEEETGYRVVYETFDSNEAMYTKVQQGGTAYDLAIPSEYMIDRMIQEELVLPLDHSKIDGLEHIDPAFLDLAFDPDNQYSIPYFWGTLGIVYNDKMIDGEEIKSWSDLWNSKYREDIMLIDGAREIIGIGLQTKGYSLNSKNDKELTEAFELLKGLAPNVKALVADEIKMYMIQEEASIAVTFSCGSCRYDVGK